MIKQMIVVTMLSLPFFANAETLLKDTAHEVKVDQEAYERVFMGCVAAFKGPEKTTFNDLDEAIEACQNAAQKIAMRSPYVSTDSKYYVTAVPVEPTK